MQQVQTDHPALSMFDRLLVTQAWKAGSVWDGQAGILRSQGYSSCFHPEGQQFYAAPSSSAIDQT
jgi:hypothetical protein